MRARTQTDTNVLLARSVRHPFDDKHRSDETLANKNAGTHKRGQIFFAVRSLGRFDRCCTKWESFTFAVSSNCRQRSSAIDVSEALHVCAEQGIRLPAFLCRRRVEAIHFFFAATIFFKAGA